MRISLILLVFVLTFLSAQAKDKVIPAQGKAIVLITSAECGFCLKNTGFYNQLTRRYRDEIPFIALYESPAKKVLSLPDLFPGKEVELKDWKVIYSAKRIYRKLIEYETYPQLIFVDNGIVVNRFIGTIDSVKNEINTHLPLFVKE